MWESRMRFPSRGIDIPTGTAGVENRQRRLRDLLEAFGSVKFQQGDDRVDGARHRGRLNVSVWDSVFHVPGDGYRVARGFPYSLQQLHIFMVGAVNQNRNFSAHAERAYVSY